MNDFKLQKFRNQLFHEDKSSGNDQRKKNLQVIYGSHINLSNEPEDP